MGRRSENLFRRNDVMRAIKCAQDSGLPVAGVEIVTKDGTVIKVTAPDASSTDQPLDKWLKEKCASDSKDSTQSASGSPTAAAKSISTRGRAARRSSASPARPS